ncbi:hypothetical protein niasHS_013346 [Heterodera schachtii]|uniref:Ion transport domain-containing protein n=1 Tax=Heterodera schachtii TaxID=97005 RepID=A0ABD2IPA1_HETSC
MEFIVVVTGVISMLPFSPSGQEGRGRVDLRTLRAVRVLRALQLAYKCSAQIHSVCDGTTASNWAVGAVCNCHFCHHRIGILFWHFSCRLLQFFGEFVNFSEKPFPCSNKSSSTGAYNCDVPGAICFAQWIGPNYGITSFDNIAFAMITVFQCITMGGWTTIMYYTNDSSGSTYNWAYFIPLIVLGSFFMLNLVLGVLSERVENRREFLKLRRMHQINRELEGYIEWIFAAEDVILNEERMTDEERVTIMEARRRANKMIQKDGVKQHSIETEEEEEDEGIDEDDDEAVENIFLNSRGLPFHRNSAEAGKRNSFFSRRGVSSYWNRKMRRLRVCLRHVVKSQIFYWSVITLVFLNTVCVASEHHGQPEWFTEFLKFLFSEHLDFSEFFKLTSYWLSLRNLVRPITDSSIQCILTGEDWNEVMYLAIESQGGVYGGGMVYCVYFIVLVLFGNYTLLNVLFLAIAVDNLANAQELTAADEVEYLQREWRLRPFNYDNTINAMLTLFVVTTSEGWPGIRQNSMDTTYEDQGPSPYYRVEVALFYVLFFIVFPFFFVNIFVALIIIITFQEQGEAELSEGDLDKNQKQCIDFALNARPRSLFMPEDKNSMKYRIWRLVTSTPFEYFIMAMLVTEFGGHFVSLGFLRLFRAARLIRLLQQGYTIRILLWTFVQSILMFGNIQLDPTSEINGHNNFQSFFNVVILLFRCATGEAWQEIMLSSTAGKPCAKTNALSMALQMLDKSSGVGPQPCGTNMSYAYFVTFVFLSSFLLGLGIELVNRRFDRIVDEHFKTRKWKLNKQFEHSM